MMVTQEVELYVTPEGAYQQALERLEAVPGHLPITFDVIRVDLERQPGLRDLLVIDTVDDAAYTYTLDLPETQPPDKLVCQGQELKIWCSYCAYVRYQGRIYEEVTE